LPSILGVIGNGYQTQDLWIEHLFYLLVLVVRLEVRFFVVAVPVVFFTGVFLAVELFTVLLAVLTVGLLATLAFEVLLAFVVVDFEALFFPAGAIASMRGATFFVGAAARTCRTASVCCSRVILNSW
jgi:hypothetical protein